MEKNAEDKTTLETEEYAVRKVCEKCGLIHEFPISPEEAGADDWKMIVMSLVGIGIVVLIWIWVFRYGVPFVKSIGGG